MAPPLVPVGVVDTDRSDGAGFVLRLRRGGIGAYDVRHAIAGFIGGWPEGF